MKKKRILLITIKMGFPSKEESMKATKRDILLRKFRRIFWFYRDLDIIIVDDLGIPYDSVYEYSLDRFDRLYEPYVKDLIDAKTTDFGLDYGPDEFFSVEERPKSLFQFKTKHTSYLHFGEPNVIETHYSVIHDRHIYNLIREGEEMEEKGGINPLTGNDIRYKANVYVLSSSAGYPSMGLYDLVEMKKKLRDYRLVIRIVFDEKRIERTVKSYDEMHKIGKENEEVKEKLEREGYMGVETGAIDYIRSFVDSLSWDECIAKLREHYGYKTEVEKRDYSEKYERETGKK